MKTFATVWFCKEGMPRPAILMAAFAVLTVLVRLPFLSDVGADEAFYLIVGRQWLDGMPPYANAFDVKPPLLFALMAAAEAIFGPSLLAAKALTMVAVAATASALYLFGRRFLGEFSGIAAALFYIVASLTLAGTVSPAELIRAPFIAFGMLAGFVAIAKPRPSLWLAASAGVLFGAAAVVKQTAIFEAALLAAFLLFSGARKEGLKAAVSFAAGCFAIPLAFALFFLAEGHFRAFLDDAAISAFGRMTARYVSWSEAVLLFLLEMTLLTPLVMLAMGAWGLRRTFRPQIREGLGFVAAWTLVSLSGVLALRAVCAFYMLAVLPPLCLMAGALVDHGVGLFRVKSARAVMRAAVFASVALFVANTVRWACFDAVNIAFASEAADAMQAAGLRKEDRILVIDRDLGVYLTSGANPPLPIFNPMHLLCDFPFESAADAMADSLASRPAFIVVSDPDYKIGCEKTERRALVKSALAEDYRIVGFFGSNDGQRRSRFALYGLKAAARNEASINLSRP